MRAAVYSFPVLPSLPPPSQILPTFASLLALTTFSSGCSDPIEAAPDSGSAVVDAALPAPSEDASADSLRLATLNLRCLVEEWDQRVPLIVEELAALDPDVIALQEVCRVAGGADALPDLVAKLEAATGSTYVVARANTHVAWDTYNEGIALLTRHRFESVETVDLPAGIFPRKAVVATIATDTHSLVAAVTHLSFGDQQGVRRNQLRSLREHLETLRTPETALLIAGDLNEGPDGSAVQGALSAGYQDAWGLLHANEAGLTYPANAPQARIDYVLVSAPGAGPQLVDAQRFLMEPSAGRYPSDHFGLWVELRAEP